MNISLNLKIVFEYSVMSDELKWTSVSLGFVVFEQTKDVVV